MACISLAIGRDMLEFDGNLSSADILAANDLLDSLAGGRHRACCC